jgi:hypothetical protein
VLAIVAAIAGIVALLTVDEIAERLKDRATISKDYDEGETGRFGNQRRSLPMLLDRPMGFGPLRFRLTFDLEPHNSYIGSFANGGWAGGISFIGLVLLTSFVGIRLCLVHSPMQRHAQIVLPSLMIYFIQGFQIDVDHWRQLYLMFGMIWGLEARRHAIARLQEVGLAPPTSPPTGPDIIVLRSRRG